MKSENFIAELHNWLPDEVCSSIIQRFDADSDKKPGLLYGGRLDLDMKRTTEICLSQHGHWSDIDQILHQNLWLGMKKYHEQYPLLDRFTLVDKGYHIKCYGPGDFFNWHCDASHSETVDRQYIAMWYLNTVKLGGCTEFRHFDRSILPEMGKLVFFPAGWTHEHRGAPPISGRKLVITAWLSVKESGRTNHRAIG